MKNEIEDGMGFAGLVSSRAERKAESALERLRKHCKELEARIAYMQITINQLHRGEFICSVCNLRKPGDVVEDDQRPPF